MESIHEYSTSMLFDPFFEVGLIVIGVLYVVSDFVIRMYDITIAAEMQKNDSEISESVKHMYS